MRALRRSFSSRAVAVLAFAPLWIVSGDRPETEPAASGPAAAATGEDRMACQFAIRAKNTLAQDVWIRFTQSEVHNQRINAYSKYLDGMQDRRLEPGESLDTRFEAPGSCGAHRIWYFVVRLGPRGAEEITVNRRTRDRADRTIDLGDASCWATTRTVLPLATGNYRIIDFDDDAIGCEAEAIRQGLTVADGSGNETPGTDATDEGAGRAADRPADPSSTAGTATVSSLEASDWVRVGGDNPRYEGMRIRIEGGRATLTAMPSTGPTSFQVGQVLWRGVAGEGAVEVRGSDGAYYASQLSADGPDRLNIDVEHNGRGNDQTWERAGPTIDGEWVLVAGGGEGYEGIRVHVDGDRATVRYVPPSAPRAFRVGDLLWRGIGARGDLEALSGSRSYRSGKASLVGDGRLRVVIDADGTLERWARPDAARELLTGGGDRDAPESLLERGEVDPSLPGDGLEPPDDLPTLDVPEAPSPPGPGPGENVCRASSLADEAMELAWAWEVEAAVLPDARAPRTDEGTSGKRRFVSDVDRSHAPGLSDHFATLTLAAGGRAFGDHREHRDLAEADFEARIESYRDEGFRPIDIEGYATASGVRYAGVWMRNREGIDWSTSYDLTSKEYGALYRERREAGYRLVDLEAYSTPDGLRYAGIWIRSCDDGNWRQWRDMDRDQYQARVDSLSDLGFRVVDFESYPTSAGQRYGAIWEEVPSRGWRVRSDRGLTGFLNYHRQYVDEGFRLIDFESYDTAEGVRYGGVWAENDPRYRYAGRDSLDALITAYRTANNLPGISVAIVQDGEVVYRRGFAWADSAARKAAHAGTVYLTASISKVIGATLAARLEEQGRIDLSDSTKSLLKAPHLYLQGFEMSMCSVGGFEWLCATLPDHHTHTLEQLLAKTGCMWHYDEGPEPQRNYYRWRTQALVQIWDSPLLTSCTPGSHYRYSTHGFTLVGAALEAATGKDMAQLLEDELTGPFELPSMRAMFTSAGLPSDYERAAAYTLSSTAEDTSAAPDTLILRPHPVTNPNVETTYENTSWKVLGGGIETNAIDLARFGWLTLNGEIVSPATRDMRLWASLTGSAVNWSNGNAAPGVGLGWRVGGPSTDRWAQHGGDGIGSGTLIKIWRDRGLVIAMLSNRRFHDVSNDETLLNRLADVVGTWPP